jgi:hypothetical protein
MKKCSPFKREAIIRHEAQWVRYAAMYLYNINGKTIPTILERVRCWETKVGLNAPSLGAST